MMLPFAAAPGADPLAPDYVTMGVTLVVFLALLGVLYVFAFPGILAGLRKREETIFAARDEAVRVQREAEELRAKLQAEFAAANDQIRAMMDEARRDADALKAAEREAGKAEAAAELGRARREIAAEKDAALQELRQESVKLAGLMASKAVRRTLTVEDHGRLLAESLDELKAGIKA
jgi:F-type H+-transporting ATPase subunit b